MKQFKLSKLIITACAFAACIGAANAQFADSSTGNRYLNGRAVIPLNNQERETPQVNNNTYVTQQIGGADLVSSSVAYLNSMPDQTYQTCGQGAGYPGSAGWALACGARACQSFGYVGGYASEVNDPNVGLICFR